MGLRVLLHISLQILQLLARNMRLRSQQVRYVCLNLVYKLVFGIVRDGILNQTLYVKNQTYLFNFIA